MPHWVTQISFLAVFFKDRKSTGKLAKTGTKNIYIYKKNLK